MSAYAGHLASLQQKTDITASEDILSNNGVLIAQAGTTLNQKICLNLLKFKLLKPIENSILIESQLTAKAIYSRITTLIDSDKNLKNLDIQLKKLYPHTSKTLQVCCLKLEKHPLLLQKLTVLELEISDVFKQSLLSAYLAATSSMLVKKDKEYIQESFLAGLIHDIGLLHIDREILSKLGTLTANEWRKVQSHPVIAFEILKRLQNIPKNVSIAVLQHHENTDGSGYPRGTSREKLSEMGQLINLLDNIIVIYNKKLKPFGKGLHSVVPIIQINMHSYFTDVVSQVFQLSKYTPETSIENFDNHILEPLAIHVQQQQEYINHLVDTIKRANDNIGENHSEQVNAIEPTQKIAINILIIINSSGLSGEHLNWVDQIKTDDNHTQLYTDIDDTRLMQGEIIYQLNTYQKAANIFINNNADNPLNSSLQEVLDHFSTTQKPAIPKALTQHWNQLSTQ